MYVRYVRRAGIPAIIAQLLQPAYIGPEKASSKAVVFPDAPIEWEFKPFLVPRLSRVKG